VVFVDGSTLRDALTRYFKDVLVAKGGRLETKLHYRKLGVLLCGEDGEFMAASRLLLKKSDVLSEPPES
jgi:hypothetical protein